MVHPRGRRACVSSATTDPLACSGSRGGDAGAWHRTHGFCLKSSTGPASAASCDGTPATQVERFSSATADAYVVFAAILVVDRRSSGAADLSYKMGYDDVKD